MNAAKSVSVSFVAETTTQHELDVTVSGEGKVDADSGAIANCREASGVCSDLYDENTVVTLTPTADSGHEFDEWGGACSGSGSCEVTMNAAKSVSVSFVAETTTQHELDVTVSGEGKVDADSGAIANCREASG